MPTQTYVCLSISSVRTPPAGEDTQGFTFVAGIAMLIAEHRRDRWRFALHADAADPDGETALLQQMTKRLPAAATVIGWKIADELLADLLHAVADKAPMLAKQVTDSLVRLFTRPCIDLSIDHGGSAAPAIGDYVASRSKSGSKLPSEELLAAWALGQTDAIQSALADQVRALWQEWVARQAHNADAHEATYRWLTQLS